MHKYKNVKEIAEFINDIASSEGFSLADPVSEDEFVIVRNPKQIEKEKKSKPKIAKTEYVLWSLKKEKDDSYSSLFQLKLPSSISTILEVDDNKKALSSEKEGVCEKFICDTIKAVLAEAFQSVESLKSKNAFSCIYIKYKDEIVDISEVVQLLQKEYEAELGVFGHAVRPPEDVNDVLKNRFAFHVASIAKERQLKNKEDAEEASLEQEGWVNAGVGFK